MSDMATGIRGVLARVLRLNDAGEKQSNIPPLDAQISVGTGPWRVTRRADGTLLMIEVWTGPVEDWRYGPGGYTMLRRDGL